MIDREIVKSIGRDCSCGRPGYWSQTPIPAPVCLGCDRQLPACVCERPVEALVRIAEALEQIAQSSRPSPPLDRYLRCRAAPSGRSDDTPGEIPTV